MHVDAVVSFAAVTLEVKFAQLLFLVWYDEVVLELALFPLKKKRSHLR